jgi:hypothetical protein
MQQNCTNANGIDGWTKSLKHYENWIRVIAYHSMRIEKSRVAVLDTATSHYVLPNARTVCVVKMAPSVCECVFPPKEYGASAEIL